MSGEGTTRPDATRQQFLAAITPFGQDYLTEDKGLTQIDAPPGTPAAAAAPKPTAPAPKPPDTGCWPKTQPPHFSTDHN